MEELELNYEGINFIVVGKYEEGELGDYETPPSYGRFDINGIYIGEHCVDFMLNERTEKELQNIILEKHYGSIV
jgi:hypothetical protein